MYGANRLKRVPVVLQNVMLYVIRPRLFNKAKIISGGSRGQLFKSWTKFTYYGIVFMVHAIQNVHEALKLVLHVAMLVLMPSQILNLYLR